MKALHASGSGEGVDVFAGRLRGYVEVAGQLFYGCVASHIEKFGLRLMSHLRFIHGPVNS